MRVRTFIQFIFFPNYEPAFSDFTLLENFIIRSLFSVRTLCASFRSGRKITNATVFDIIYHAPVHLSPGTWCDFNATCPLCRHAFCVHTDSHLIMVRKCPGRIKRSIMSRHSDDNTYKANPTPISPPTPIQHSPVIVRYVRPRSFSSCGCIDFGCNDFRISSDRHCIAKTGNGRRIIEHWPHSSQCHFRRPLLTRLVVIWNGPAVCCKLVVSCSIRLCVFIVCAVWKKSHSF